MAEQKKCAYCGLTECDCEEDDSDLNLRIKKSGAKMTEMEKYEHLKSDSNIGKPELETFNGSARPNDRDRIKPPEQPICERCNIPNCQCRKIISVSEQPEYIDVNGRPGKAFREIEQPNPELMNQCFRFKLKDEVVRGMNREQYYKATSWLRGCERVVQQKIESLEAKYMEQVTTNER